jgi:hypothetical protein
MATIEPEEKKANKIVETVEAKATDTVELIFAAVGSPAEAGYRVRRVKSQSKKSESFTTAEFKAANGRITRKLLLPKGFYSLTADIILPPIDWESMLKLEVNGVEKYRRYIKHKAATPPTSLGPVMGILLIVE